MPKESILKDEATLTKWLLQFDRKYATKLNREAFYTKMAQEIDAELLKKSEAPKVTMPKKRGK